MASNYWIIIPAAGIGERFNGALPKQYTTIHGKTILQHSLERFIYQPWVSKVIVPVANKDSFVTTLSCANHPKISCVMGGELRMHSVMNALNYLKNFADHQDWVLVHDAVRACLHQDDLNKLIDSLKDEKVGGLLCSKVTDTIKFSLDGNILHTVDRTPLWQALTPQMFRFEVLYHAFEHCFANEITITDEGSAIEHLGLSSKVVEGQYPNPKLTYPQDLAVFSLLLNKLSQ